MTSVIQTAKQNVFQRPLLVSLINCLYEVQDPSLCLFVVDQYGGEPELWGTSLSPLDCLSLGYFMSCVSGSTSLSNEVFHMNFYNCSIDDQRCKFLMKGLSRIPICNSTETGSLSMELGRNAFVKLELGLYPRY